MRHQPVRFALLLGALLMVVMASVAQGRQSDPRQFIHLRGASFDPLIDGEPVEPALASAEETGSYYLIQFRGPVESAWIEQLTLLGAEILGYLPEHTHIARIADTDLAKVRDMYAVRWVGPYRSVYKLAPEFAEPSLATADAPATVTVLGHPGESHAALAAFLQAQGATISDSADMTSGPTFRVTLPTERLGGLALNPAIAWVEPYVAPMIQNGEGRRIMGVERVWESRGLFGEGQIVAVSDSGLSVGSGTNQTQLSDDFAGRLVRAYSPAEMVPNDTECAAKTSWTDLNGHGTHVAGSVLGSGALSGADVPNNRYNASHAGSAPKARMVFMAMNTDGSNAIQCIPVNGNYIAFGYENGARISSNSWGSDAQGAYTQGSSSVDDYIWRNQDYLVLYAAGNAGRNGPQTIGAPGSAKNILTVGASENNRPDLGGQSDNPNTVADFSSRGPTADGRVKPDVVAPGTNILSVLGAEARDLEPVAPGVPYAYSSGTSMATPLVAGVAAQVREWVQKERGVENPSAALLKSLIIHGSSRMAGGLPSFDSGWGRVDLKNTLDARYAVFEDNRRGLNNGQQQEYTVQVAGSTPNATLFVDPVAAAPTLQSTAAFAVTAEPVIQGGSLFDEDDVTVQTVPGYSEPNGTISIPEAAGAGKAERTPITAVPALPNTANGNLTMQAAPYTGGPTTNAFAYNVVLGGDFEDGTAQNPGWELFGQLWLGTGIPLRTDASLGEPVLNGEHSMWLGGTESSDAIYYPVSFPRNIDSANASGVQFLLAMEDLDVGFDQFCFGITDASGYVIAGAASCTDGTTLEQGINTITVEFKQELRDALAGESGYLVLLTASDALEPHMSAFVDDVLLQIDYPNVGLGAAPNSGPPGTTFLLAGINAVPYFPVNVCIQSCNSAENVIDTVYADARGDVFAYLETGPQAQPGNYTVAISDFAGRSATTQVTLVGSTPQLQIAPASGPAGSEFVINGTNFTPNDNRLTMTINGQDQGTLGSDANGAFSITLRTPSNVPAGTYTVVITDGAGRSATAQFQVTGAGAGQATMSVSPSSGAPGSAFNFTGSGFTPAQPISFALDGQEIGQVNAEADGSFGVTLTTSQNIPAGTYTMTAVQGQRQASAQFQITGGGGGGQQPPASGKGLYVTLVWTDPPAQAGAGRTLVNNLDLEVIGPDNTKYLGNGGQQADVLNNVEGVRIENPAPGTYKIIVKATSLNGAFGSQPYALVATTGQSYNSTNNDSDLGETPRTLNNKLYLPLLRK